MLLQTMLRLQTWNWRVHIQHTLHWLYCFSFSSSLFLLFWYLFDFNVGPTWKPTLSINNKQVGPLTSGRFVDSQTLWWMVLQILRQRSFDILSSSWSSSNSSDVQILQQTVEGNHNIVVHNIGKNKNNISWVYANKSQIFIRTDSWLLL